ncbi:hypothetical protein AMTRI_Chr06g195880 [Amborella trichopoda]
MFLFPLHLIMTSSPLSACLHYHLGLLSCLTRSCPLCCPSSPLPPFVTSESLSPSSPSSMPHRSRPRFGRTAISLAHPLQRPSPSPLPPLLRTPMGPLPQPPFLWLPPLVLLFSCSPHPLTFSAHVMAVVHSFSSSLTPLHSNPLAWFPPTLSFWDYSLLRHTVLYLIFSTRLLSCLVLPPLTFLVHPLPRLPSLDLPLPPLLFQPIRLLPWLLFLPLLLHPLFQSLLRLIHPLLPPPLLVTSLPLGVFQHLGPFSFEL